MRARGIHHFCWLASAVLSAQLIRSTGDTSVPSGDLSRVQTRLTHLNIQVPPPGVGPAPPLWTLSRRQVPSVAISLASF